MSYLSSSQSLFINTFRDDPFTHAPIEQSGPDNAAELKFYPCMRAGKRNNQGSDRDSVSSTSSTKSEDANSTSLISHDRSSGSLAATTADPMPLPVHKTQAAFVNKLYR